MYSTDNQFYLLLNKGFVLPLNKENLQQFNSYNYEKFKYYLGSSDGLCTKHNTYIGTIDR